MAESQDPRRVMGQIEAAALGAQVNAYNHGGDNADAAMTLLCAFALLSVRAGVEPDVAMAKAWEHAKGAVADFWPKGRGH